MKITQFDFISDFRLMSKHRHISVKSYYQRAKVFGYLTLVVVITLIAINLFDKLFK